MRKNCGAGLLIFATLAVGLYPKLLLDRIVPAVEIMRFLQPMNYLELLQLAAPEAIIVATALLVLTLGLLGGGRTASATVSSALGRLRILHAGRGGLERALRWIGLASPLRSSGLPAHADVFHGMLVISPLNSLFQGHLPARLFHRSARSRRA